MKALKKSQVISLFVVVTALLTGSATLLPSIGALAIHPEFGIPALVLMMVWGCWWAFSIWFEGRSHRQFGGRIISMSWSVRLGLIMVMAGLAVDISSLLSAGCLWIVCETLDSVVSRLGGFLSGLLWSPPVFFWLAGRGVSPMAILSIAVTALMILVLYRARGLRLCGSGQMTGERTSI